MAKHFNAAKLYLHLNTQPNRARMSLMTPAVPAANLVDPAKVKKSLEERAAKQMELAATLPPFCELTEVLFADHNGELVTIEPVRAMTPWSLAEYALDVVMRCRSDVGPDRQLHVYHLGLDHPWQILMDNYRMAPDFSAGASRALFSYGEDAPQFFDLMELAYPSAGRKELAAHRPDALFPGYTATQAHAGRHALGFVVHVAKHLGIYDGK